MRFFFRSSSSSNCNIFCFLFNGNGAEVTAVTVAEVMKCSEREADEKKLDHFTQL